MNTVSVEAVEHYLYTAGKEVEEFLQQLSPEIYIDAVKLINDTRSNGNRLHVTGIGKCSHVATYIASLLSSTGNPAYYLHGTEAVHGSCGQLMEGDVVIAISNSGETQELKLTCNAVRNNGCKIIGVSGNENSWLAQNADVFLFAGIQEEGGPLNRAPRTSVLAELLTLQTMSVALQAERDWTPEQYVRCHPGGTLGQLRENEK